MWLAGSYLQSDWVMSGPGEFWWRLWVTQQEYTMKKVSADINLEGPLTSRKRKKKPQQANKGIKKHFYPDELSSTFNC